MWQQAFVLEYTSKVTTVDPPAAGRAPNEMLGLIRGRLSDALANVFPARDHLAQSSSASRFTAGAAGFTFVFLRFFEA
jgi:hypothetical protein